MIDADIAAYTASQAGLLAQLNAIRKAAKAGIKLFVTCEYTLEFDETDIPTSPYSSAGGKVLTEADLEGETYPLVKLRREAVQLAEELGLPVLQVHLGECSLRCGLCATIPGGQGALEDGSSTGVPVSVITLGQVMDSRRCCSAGPATYFPADR